MAAQTGNSYISGTIIDSVEIPTAILGFSIMTSSKKVSSNECDNDRQPEIAILPRAAQTGNTYIEISTSSIIVPEI